MTISKPGAKKSSRRISPDEVSVGEMNSRANLVEREFQPTRSEFEQLAEASNDAIRIINSDFTIRYINHAFAEMTGVEQKDVIDKKCWEVFPSALCHTPECRASRALNGQQKIQIEIERQKHDGTSIPCAVTASPLKDSAGNVTGIIEQFRDITERRYMEQRIEESNERYRAMIELGTNIGEAVVMLQNIGTKEGAQTYVSEQWPLITGYTEEELLSISFFDIVSPEDRFTAIQRHRQKMAGKPIPNLFELSIIRKDNKEVPIELTSAVTKYRNKPANVVYIRDITERRKAETKYKAIIENSITGFWIATAKNKLLEVNDAYCKMIGYTREELLNMYAWEFDIID
jgi:PAS domain S-box-containing protein